MRILSCARNIQVWSLIEENLRSLLLDGGSDWTAPRECRTAKLTLQLSSPSGLRTPIYNEGSSQALLHTRGNPDPWSNRFKVSNSHTLKSLMHLEEGRS
ncbi:hypothetical protein VNO77_05161 [Canavalia gladiata]|uniref:Uncharacterized protein n=1 Tax=Canavalia gladiata TaxID=3824 RepID=A0AAN9R8E5_CANGL